MPPLTLGLGFARGPVTASAPSLILDSLSAGAAYSTRKLRTAYAGSALRVRRSSDNTEQDIGFSGNSLDTAALSSFVGANNGFVVTWYDQSGNARHITNATTTQQPRIVNAGTIETLNSQPAVNFDGSDDRLGNSSPFLYAAGACTIFVVHSLDAPAPVGTTPNFIFESSSTSSTPRYQIRANSDLMEVQIVNDAGTVLRSLSTLQSTTFDNVAKVTAIRDSGSAIEGFRNGTLGSAPTYTRSGALTLNRFSLNGVDINGTQFGGAIGPISEAIFFTSSLSNTNFNTVGANRGAAYGITVNPI